MTMVVLFKIGIAGFAGGLCLGQLCRVAGLVFATYFAAAVTAGVCVILSLPLAQMVLYFCVVSFALQAGFLTRWLFGMARRRKFEQQYLAGR